MASALDLSSSAVQELKERGMPMHSASAARAWRKKNLNQAQTKGVAEGAEDFMLARARKESAQADIAEMDAEKMRGELIEKAVVRAEFAKQAGAVRDGLLNIPARLAPVLAAETGLAAVQTLLDTEIRAVLAQFVGEA
jgi:phage terminase Nu1 subunit (DNA packaging protein)